MTKKRKRIIIGVVVVAILVFIIMMNISSSGGGDAPGAGPVVSAQVERVKRRMVEQTVAAAGKIQPVFETEISSTVSAQILRILVQEGEEVAPGDTLVILDSKRYTAAHERARSALRSARARLKQITAELERGRQLYGKNLISLQDMEALDASYEAALSQVEQSVATLEQAVDDLDKTVLVAPENGIVTRINKEVGEMALGSTFQADVLLIIADLSMMEVLVEVDETDVVDITSLDPVKVEVDAIPDTVFEGRVSKIAHSATVRGLGSQDQVTNFEIVVTLDVSTDSRRVDPRIRPGMSATATITTARHPDVAAIPIQALTARLPVRKTDGEESSGEEGSGRRGNRNPRSRSQSQSENPDGENESKPELQEVVFVVKEDTTGTGVDNSGGFLKRLFSAKRTETVEQRPVTVGISSDTYYEVLSGLTDGELIVVGNYRAVSKDLKDGSRIERKKQFEGRPMQGRNR